MKITDFILFGKFMNTYLSLKQACEKSVEEIFNKKRTSYQTKILSFFPKLSFSEIEVLLELHKDKIFKPYKKLSALHWVCLNPDTRCLKIVIEHYRKHNQDIQVKSDFGSFSNLNFSSYALIKKNYHSCLLGITYDVFPHYDFLYGCSNSFIKNELEKLNHHNPLLFNNIKDKSKDWNNNLLNIAFFHQHRDLFLFMKDFSFPEKQEWEKQLEQEILYLSQHLDRHSFYDQIIFYLGLYYPFHKFFNLLNQIAHLNNQQNDYSFICDSLEIYLSAKYIQTDNELFYKDILSSFNRNELSCWEQFYNRTPDNLKHKQTISFVSSIHKLNLSYKLSKELEVKNYHRSLNKI